MPQENKAQTLRKVFQAKIAHLPYAEQRQLTEMLRDMSNERNSRLAQEAKRAKPVQSNAMSDAVSMRGQEPPQAPRKITPLARAAETGRQKGVAKDIAKKYEQIKASRPIPVETVQPPPEVPRQVNPESFAAGLSEQADKIRAERMTGRLYGPDYTGRPIALGSEKLANDAAYGAAESRLGRMAGRLGYMADIAMEYPMIGFAGRLARRSGPAALIDLFMPSKNGVSNGEISGGDMYPLQDSIAYSALGGSLPPELERRNAQIMERRRQNDEQLQAAQTQRYRFEDPGYSPRMQGNIPIYNNPQPQQQTYQEPQSIAQRLAAQEPNFEPQSIASQLSTQSPQDQYTDAPQVSIAQELKTQDPPKSLMEHYVKIYGSPDKAREAMAQKGAYQQSQIQ